MFATVSYPNGVTMNIEGDLIYKKNPNSGDLLTTDSFGLASWISSVPMLENIYNTDGILTGARTIGLNAYPISFISTNSAAYFEVRVAGANGILLGKDANGDQSSRLFFSNGNLGEHGAILNSGANLDFRTNANAGSSTGNQRMVINSSGNVGINEGSPSARLHVVSGSTQSGILVTGSTTEDLVRITQTGTGNALLVEDSTNPDSTPFVINSSGNVGINEGSPSARLHVVSGSTQSGIFVTGSTTEDLVRITQTGTGNAFLVEDGSNPDSTPFVIDSIGNVGIGTSSATHMLTLGKGGGVSIYGATSGFVYIKSKSSVVSWTASLPANKGNISSFIYNNFGGEIMLNDGEGNLFFGTTPSLYLPETYMFIGNTYSYAVGRVLSGDVKNDYTGVMTIQPGVVSYAKMQIMSQKAVLGTTNVSGGNVTELPLYNSYISIGPVSTYLENVSNWTGVSYTGPTITGTFQGQNHYNGAYFYTAVDDNLWIRFSRV